MAKLERVYNIPIRKEWLRAPSYKRAKRAISAVRMFLQRHMKSEDVRLGAHINHNIWQRGIKHPPHHVKVTAIKDDSNVVRAELFGMPIEEPKKQEKKGKLETLKEKFTGAKEPAPQATIKPKAEIRTAEPKKDPNTKKVEKE